MYPNVITKVPINISIRMRFKPSLVQTMKPSEDKAFFKGPRVEDNEVFSLLALGAHYIWKLLVGLYYNIIDQLEKEVLLFS